MDLPDKRETWEFLRADSRLFHLLELAVGQPGCRAGRT